MAAQQRRLTVVTRYREHGHVPEIRMGGNWLNRAGFTAGSRLAITVTPGHLVVRVVAPPRPPPTREVHEEPNTSYCLTPGGAKAARRLIRRDPWVRKALRR